MTAAPDSSSIIDAFKAHIASSGAPKSSQASRDAESAAAQLVTPSDAPLNATTNSASVTDLRKESWSAVAGLEIEPIFGNDLCDTRRIGSPLPAAVLQPPNDLQLLPLSIDEGNGAAGSRVPSFRVADDRNMSPYADNVGYPAAEDGYWLPPTLVRVNRRDGAVLKETAALVAGWLQEQGFAESLRALRSDVGMVAQDDYKHRKALRVVAAAVAEGRWDSALAAARNLLTLSMERQENFVRPSSSAVVDANERPTVSPVAEQTSTSVPVTAYDAVSADRRISLLLMEQQLLELVDSGDAAKTFAFFTRKVKPMESDMTPCRFQRLLYACTCKSVAEASAGLALQGDATLAGWSVEAGRANLIEHIRHELIASHASSEGHSGLLLGTDTYISKHAITPLPGTLHLMFEMAESYVALRTALLLGRASASEILNALSDPLAAPCVLQSFTQPLTAQLPPLKVLRSTVSKPPMLHNTTSLCRASYISTLHCVIYGTSSGSLYVVHRPTFFSEPQTDTAARRSKISSHHSGPVCGLSVAEDPTNGALPLVLSTSVDGTATLHSLWIDNNNSVLSRHVTFASEVHGSGGPYITACSLVSDGSIAVLGDAYGRVSLWGTGTSTVPATAKSRHATPSLADIILLHLVTLDPKLLPQAVQVEEGWCKPATVKGSSHEATAWASNAVVSIESSRHGLHVVVLQKSGIVNFVSTALGVVLRRIAAPDIMGRLADASSLAISSTALHGFVAFGLSKCVRVLNFTDGTWLPDVFTLPEEASFPDIITTVTSFNNDSFIVAGTATGRLISWSCFTEYKSLSPVGEATSAHASPATDTAGKLRRTFRPVSVLQLPQPTDQASIAEHRCAVADLRVADVHTASSSACRGAKLLMVATVEQAFHWVATPSV